MEYKGVHSILGQLQIRGLFTPEQEHKYVESRAATAEGKRGAFDDIPGLGPDKEQVSNRMKRDGKKTRATEGNSKHQFWTVEMIKLALANAAIPVVTAETIHEYENTPHDIKMVSAGAIRVSFLYLPIYKKPCINNGFDASGRSVIRSTQCQF